MVQPSLGVHGAPLAAPRPYKPPTLRLLARASRARMKCSGLLRPFQGASLSPASGREAEKSGGLKTEAFSKNCPLPSADGLFGGSRCPWPIPSYSEVVLATPARSCSSLLTPLLSPASGSTNLRDEQNTRSLVVCLGWWTGFGGGVRGSLTSRRCP
jgi:hypothetical protein